jgi:hypothetical protein
MSGLFTAIGGTLENGMSTYVTNVSSALSGALVPVATTAVTIWILAYGLAIVRGEAHEAVPAFAWRGLKVAVILAFALGSGLYQQQVVTAVSGATSGLAQAIQIAANTTGGGNPGCGSVSGSSVTSTSATSIYQTLDCYDQQIDLAQSEWPRCCHRRHRVRVHRGGWRLDLPDRARVRGRDGAHAARPGAWNWSDFHRVRRVCADCPLL